MGAVSRSLALLAVVMVAAPACKSLGRRAGENTDAATTTTGPPGTASDASADPGGVLPYPSSVESHVGGGFPLGLTPADAFAVVLSCQDYVQALSLEGRAVVVRWPDQSPGVPAFLDDPGGGPGTDTPFRLARWDEATGRFEEMEGPHLSLTGRVQDVQLAGTWSAPQLFVMEKRISFRSSGGHRLLLDSAPYHFAAGSGATWRTGDGVYTPPPEPPGVQGERLDEDLRVDEAKMAAALAKVRPKSKACAQHDGMNAFTPGWRVGWFGGAAGCAKPITYALHQRRDGKIESTTWPTTNDAPSTLRVRVEIIDHAWHVLLSRPDMQTQVVVLDRLLRYDGTQLTPIPLPNDQLGNFTWHRGPQLCVSGQRNMWCKNGNEWMPAGPGNCTLTVDDPEFQSGVCSRPKGIVPVVGDGRGAFRELSPMRNPASCSRVWGRSFATLLCGAGLGPGATLVFLPTPTTELDFAVPDPSSEDTLTFVGDVAWAARNQSDGDMMQQMRGINRQTKIVTRLGKPVRPWTCSADGSHLEQH